MNLFGNHVEVITHDHENGVYEKHITIKEDSHYSIDYEQQAHHLNDLTSYLKNEKTFKTPIGEAPKNLTCQSTRSGPDDPTAQFMFLPAYTGILSPSQNSTITAEGTCFEDVNLSITYSDESPEKVSVVANMKKKKTPFCTEVMLLANTDA